MKRIIVALTTLMLLASCIKEETPPEPVVVVSGIDYYTNPLNVPYHDAHNAFADYYTGSDLCLELRAEIIEKMSARAESLYQNSDVLQDCIKAIYSDWSARPNRIPCYAERCLYDKFDVWAIAYNRANSFDEESVSHWDLVFVDCNTHLIVLWLGCKCE